jgi:GLPGLI family protein
MIKKQLKNKQMKLFTKSIISSLIFFFVTITAIGQTEGKITYIQTSNWAKMMAGIDYISAAQRDRNMYLFGNRSGWKQYKILNYTQELSKYENSDENAQFEMMGWSRKKELFFIENNLKESSSHLVMTFSGKQYIISDSIRNYKWKIGNNLKEIVGHICMNATTFDSLRKQNIEAWFALDLPVSSGPDRFAGLPGMILELDINKGAMNYVAEKIEDIDINTAFTKPKKIKGKKINLVQLNELYKKSIEDKTKMEQPWFWEVPY